MTPRLLWLLFALLVVLVVFVPKIVTAQPLIACDSDGICYPHQSTLKALIDLAAKAGKDCT